MNRTNMLRWIEALESGEYWQVKGPLMIQDGSAFCALGVGVALMQKDEGLLPHLRLSWRADLADWVAMKDSRVVDFFDDVARMNDSTTATFPEVAAWMRARCDLPKIDPAQVDVWQDQLEDADAPAFAGV